MRDARAALVVVGSYLPGSGFTRVIQSLLPHLAVCLRIDWIGIGYKGPPRDLEGYRLLPSNLEGGDVFGAYQAARLAQDKDAVVLLINDLWMLSACVLALGRPQCRVPVVAYCPLDGKIRDDRFCQAIQGFDAVVTYTQFALEEFRGSFGRLAERGELRSEPPMLEVIGHGVDSHAFRPLSDAERGDWRRTLFGYADLADDTIVILNANRPTPRKRIDLSIEGFARAADRVRQPIYLCLHQALTTGEERQRLGGLIERLGLAGRILLTRGAMDEETLNGLYNACQIGLNTSMGEGWGLISFEHAATGAAQIVPRHSACSELWEGAAMLMKPVRQQVPDFSPLELEEADPEQVAAGIETLVGDEALRGRLAARGGQRALDSRYRWDRLAAQWCGLVEKVRNGQRGIAW